MCMCICKAPPLQRLLYAAGMRGRYEPIKVGLCSSPSTSLRVSMVVKNQDGESRASDRDKIPADTRERWPREVGKMDALTFTLPSTASLTGALPLGTCHLPARKKHSRKGDRRKRKRRRSELKTKRMHWHSSWVTGQGRQVLR